MDYWLSSLYTDPLYWVGALCALGASIGIIMFFSGLVPGIFHMIGNNGNYEHTSHQRARAVWGIYILGVTFVVWEIIRLVFVDFSGALYFALGVVVLVVVGWLLGKIK